MIAKLAYLTSPAPNRFVLNFMPEDGTATFPIEISKAHLANILIDGLSFSLRETCVNRVPETIQPRNANERAGT